MKILMLLFFLNHQGHWEQLPVVGYPDDLGKCHEKAQKLVELLDTKFPKEKHGFLCFDEHDVRG